MVSSQVSTDPHRRTKLIAAVVAAVTIVCLLALVVIVAREQVAGSAIAVEDARRVGDAGDERRALEALLVQDPHDDAAVAKLAALATAERRWPEAAAQWGKVAKLDPLHPDARYEQARSLLALGDADGAVAALNADGRTLTGREHVLLARAALLSGDLGAARTQAAAAAAVAPDLSAAKLLAADIAFLSDDDDSAAPLYEALLTDQDSAAAAQLGLAQIALRAGDVDAGLARLKGLPDDAGYQVQRARAALYRQLGRMDAARADYEVLIDRYGPLPDLVVPLAELRAAQDDAAGVRNLRMSLVGTASVDLAARHYLQAIEHYLAGDAAESRDYLGWSAEFFGGRDLYRWMQLEVGAELGDPGLVGQAARSLTDGVVSPLRRARAAAVLTARAAELADAGDADDARMLAEVALQLVPDLPAARLVAARAALLSGDHAAAAGLAEDLVDDAEYRDAALELLGRAALRARDLPSAAGHFAELAEAMPDAAVGRYWQGVTAARAGDLDAALVHLRGAYSRSADPRIETALMDVLMQQEDWAAATAFAQPLAESDDPGTRARGQAYLGGVLSAQGQIEGAAVAYAEAAATDPARSPYALMAGDLYMASAQWEAAAAVLAAAADVHPDNRYIAFKQALLAQRMGQGEEAEQRYRAVLTASPGWALPMVNLSELLAASAQTEALELAERAAQLTPDWADSNWNLAQRRADAGDNAGALQAARRVLALAPEHAEAQAMVRRLEQGS